MKTYRIFAIVITTLLVSVMPAQANGTRPWRLPFDGVMTITDAMGEELHINASSEAIDYGNGNSIPIKAPFDGTVLDVITVGDFGTVLRINHASAVTSFFAHLAYVNQVGAGSSIYAGQIVAYSGNTGTGGNGYHLHYEARTNAIAGNVYSGQSIPVRAVSGNWFNSFYSPSPNFQYNTLLSSGGAQYPENSTGPSTLNTSGGPGRHLWEVESPLDRPLFYLSNIQSSDAVLHLGGSPATPNTNYAVTFLVEQLKASCGCWDASPGWLSVTPYTFVMNSANQSDPNGQHTLVAWSYDTLRGYSTDNRYIDVALGDVAQNFPHITAISDYATQETILEYAMPGASNYTVYESHGGNATLTYLGPSSSIRVNRTIGGQNLYTVQAYFPATQTYSQWSLWVIVKTY